MKEFTISDIEKLTEEEVKSFNGEYMSIKEHNCYFVDFGGYFGYSVLVFKNGKHIHYANDYQLYHPNRVLEELKDWYIEALERKLFTEYELFQDVKDYDDYQRKSYYIRNYWIMQYDYVSAFYIGKASDELINAMNTMYFNTVSFCYVNDKNIIKKEQKLIDHVKMSFETIKNGEEVFRKMIAHELANHEACITCSASETLDALGLRFEDLPENQQRIIKEELDKQLDNYYM